MHWTLLAMLALIALAFAEHCWAAWLTGQVRWIGLGLALAWSAQELVWWRTGDNSLALYIGSDLALLAALWRRWPAWHWTDWGIAALFLPEWAVNAHDQWMGITRLTWWAGFAFVFVQILLGLPWPGWQRTISSITHGPLRAGSVTQ